MQDPDLFSGIVVAISLLLFGSLALFITRYHRQYPKFQIKLFASAMALRFLTSVVIYQFGLVNILKDEDSSGWVRGVAYASRWTQQKIGLLELPQVMTNAYQGNHLGYYYLLGGFFYLTDFSARLPAAALNCFFGALTVVLVYSIARSLYSEPIARRVGWWTCLLPSMIIWSAQTIKEPVVILLETAALYGCVKLKLSGFSLRHLTLIAASIILVIPFRFYAAYIAGIAVLVTLLLPQLAKRKFTLGSAIAVAALVIPLLIATGALVKQEAEFERFDTRRMQQFRIDVATGSGGRSGIKMDFDMNSPGGLVASIIVGGAHLMLAPFPWQLGGASLRMLFTLPELIVWWWLFFAGVIPGMWSAMKTRLVEVLPLLIFIFGLGLLYSLMFGNIGLAYRQRAQLLPWLLIFAVVGLQMRAAKKLLKQHQRAANMPAAPPRAAQVVAQT